MTQGWFVLPGLVDAVTDGDVWTIGEVALSRGEVGLTGAVVAFCCSEVALCRGEVGKTGGERLN